MRAFSLRWSPARGWSDTPDSGEQSDVQLLLAFGPVDSPGSAWFADVARRWPNARLVYATAGGQIDGLDVLDADVVLTGLAFEHASVHVIESEGAGIVPDVEMGRALGARPQRAGDLVRCRRGQRPTAAARRRSAATPAQSLGSSPPRPSALGRLVVTDCAAGPFWLQGATPIGQASNAAANHRLIGLAFAEQDLAGAA